MKVYNKEKTEILETYDPTKGFLKPDKILKEHHEAVKENTAEEKAKELIKNGANVEKIGEKLYEIKAVYENGREVKEVKANPAKEAYDEYEDIKVYIPYTEQEIKAQEKIRQIAEYKKYLADTDYIVLKIAEALAENDTKTVTALKTTYVAELAKRKAWREQINELEK